MKCYHCGATLTQHDFCTACKSDVRQYKLIMESTGQRPERCDSFFEAVSQIK